MCLNLTIILIRKIYIKRRTCDYWNFFSTFHILGPDRGFTSLTLGRNGHTGPALCLNTGHLRRKLKAQITPARTVNTQRFLPTRRHYRTTGGMIIISAKIFLQLNLLTLKMNWLPWGTTASRTKLASISGGPTKEEEKIMILIPLLYIHLLCNIKMITAVNIPSTSLWIGGVETVVVMVVSGSSGVIWTSSRVLMALEAVVATGLPDPSPGALSFCRCCRFSRLLTLVSQEPDRLPWQSCSDHCMQINCKCRVTAIY